MGQSSSPNSSAADDRNLVRDRAIKELGYALVATAITFVLAVLFYMYVPVLRENMRDKDEGLKHTRVFTSDATGGSIQYRFSQTENGETFDVAIDRYIEDLELLSRRFQRGDFEMVLLSGMTDSPEYAAMVRHQEAFEYNVVKDPEGPSLVIRAKSPAARQALHDYLQYLETRWVF
jgi:hypothetical protein